jgi:DNA ligase (NAD+)
VSLKLLLEQASKAYYEGKPIMPDYQFDEIAKLHEWKKIGYGGTDDRIKHKYKIYSLQKFFTDSDKWVWYFETFMDHEIVETPKLDGACVSLLYKQGILIQALTRGDGIEGIDITDKIVLSNIVPHQLKHMDYSQGDVSNASDESMVTGEVVAPKSITNSRNYSAGALNLKDTSEFISRDLTFIAHDLQPAEDLYSWSMDYLRYSGFDVITDGEWEQFPHDGRVFRINMTSEFEKWGYTSHHPRGAYALKEQKEIQQTILKDVIWQVGKSGQVSPVALLEPVEIGGAIVQRATLHNIAYIEDLGLEIGCGVEVIRSGEIIPRIVGVVEK